MEQRTKEWYAARKGRLTASTFGEAVGLVGSRRRLWRELTGREERHENEFMSHGTDWEPYARRLYEAARGVEVQQVGFVAHPSLDWLGGSPDGFVGDDGVAEFKCPQKMYPEFPEKYLPQVQGIMHMSRRDWCDLMVCVPPVKDEEGNVVAEEQAGLWRVYRCDEYWYELLEMLTAFWGFVLADVEPPKFKRGSKPQFKTLASVRIDPFIKL